MVSDHSISVRVGGGVLLFCMGALCASAWGQTDESLLLKPWEEKQVFDGSGDVRIFGTGGVEHSTESTGMIEAKSAGRYRFTTKYPIGPTVGYDYTTLSLDGKHLPVPNDLTDVSAGFASPVGLIGGSWFLGFSAAVGYAGDEPFGNGRAWYGKGSLMSGTQLSKDSALILYLDYNGNRTIFPDVPLPGFAYSKTVSPQLEYVLGTVAYVKWKPVEGLTINAMYEPPVTVSAGIEYEFVKNWKVFLTYDSQELAFHAEGLPENRRLFYGDEQAELGVRWQVNQWASFSVAGGFAFTREFSSGFDDRDLDRIARLSDVPYLRVGFGVEF
jgi:hypothetical protein